jgi:hypothetical protein
MACRDNGTMYGGMSFVFQHRSICESVLCRPVFKLSALKSRHERKTASNVFVVATSAAARSYRRCARGSMPLATKDRASSSRTIIGAGNETRTRDLNLGKVALYQLSYSRPKQTRNCRAEPPGVKKKSDKNAAKALNGPAISLGGRPGRRLPPWGRISPRTAAPCPVPHRLEP